LSATNAQRARFDGAELTGTDFSGAKLADASLRDAKLCARQSSPDARVDERVACANLRNADLHGTDLRGALLCSAHREDCRPLERTELVRLAHADLTGATFGG
jgi:uncharacterized protein YjbI with pentapeptide repeats